MKPEPTMPALTETVLPIYVVGDSHALPYRNLMFREKWTGQWVMARSRYIPGLTAEGLFDPATGEFHHELVEFLQYEGLVRNGMPTHLSRHEFEFAIAKASGLAITPPLLLLSAGDVDIRVEIMPSLADKYEFIPPFDTGLPVLDRPLLPWDVIEQAIEQRVKPMIAGLRQLIACGFNRLYVQGVVPPSKNEALVRQLYGYGCPVSVRTKLALAFNRKLADECRPLGVAVIDNWDRLADGAGLRPELEFDGVHLSPQASRWFLDELLEHAINCQRLAVNHVRYELYYRMACGLAPFQA